jgi:hypothetical protein
MRKLQLKNKKGMNDVLFIIVTLMLLAMSLFIIVYIGGIFNDKLAPVFNDAYNGSGTVMTTTINNAIEISDWGFLIAFILASLGLILSAFLIYTHPAFLVVFMLMTVVFIVASAYISNVYYEFSRTPEFATALSELPITDYILQHLPLITLILCILSIVVIYSKSQSQGGMSSGM